MEIVLFTHGLVKVPAKRLRTHFLLKPVNMVFSLDFNGNRTINLQARRNNRKTTPYPFFIEVRQDGILLP